MMEQSQPKHKTVDNSNSNLTNNSNVNSDDKFEQIFNSEDALRLFKPFDQNKDYKKAILKLAARQSQLNDFIVSTAYEISILKNEIEIVVD